MSIRHLIVVHSSSLPGAASSPSPSPAAAAADSEESYVESYNEMHSLFVSGGVNDGRVPYYSGLLPSGAVFDGGGAGGRAAGPWYGNGALAPTRCPCATVVKSGVPVPACDECLSPKTAGNLDAEAVCRALASFSSDTSPLRPALFAGYVH
jgi:hypothetical protein